MKSFKAYQTYQEYCAIRKWEPSEEHYISWNKHVIYCIEDLYREHDITAFPVYCREALLSAIDILKPTGDVIWIASAEDLLEELKWF